MFWTRLVSGIVLLIMAIVFIFVGGLPLWAISLLISLIGMFELYRVLKIEKKAVSWIGYIGAVVYYSLLYFKISSEYEVILFVVMLLLEMVIYVFTFPEYKTEEITASFFGLFYVAVLFSFLYQTRTLKDGKLLAWLILISSWGSDTCAYAVGMLIGKHKVTPKLSPKKSLEGCIGGVCGAALNAYIYAIFVRNYMVEVENPLLACTVGCALGAVVSQIGDLAASAIKRNHEIKDYGNLIPGHGGILDRFDSMLFTAPIVFFAVMFLG